MGCTNCVAAHVVRVRAAACGAGAAAAVAGVLGRLVVVLVLVLVLLLCVCVCVCGSLPHPTSLAARLILDSNGAERVLRNSGLNSPLQRITWSAALISARQLAAHITPRP
jgi:hypothetical protein